MMNVYKKLNNAGLLPVAVLDDGAQAVATAQAVLASGIDVLELDLGGTAGLESLAQVAHACPDITLGVSGVCSMAQFQEAVERGAQFIVTQGWIEDIALWCKGKSVAMIPVCSTIYQMQSAIEFGVSAFKFDPENPVTPLEPVVDLCARFEGVGCIPLSQAGQVTEYTRSPFIMATSGSWLCPQKDVQACCWHNITALCAEARHSLLGYELLHLGVNTENLVQAQSVCSQWDKAFGLPASVGPTSTFVTNRMEIMHEPYLGAHGHIAIGTNHIARAIAALEKAGFLVDPETEKYVGQRLMAVYLKDSFGGFAVHLLQK